MFFFIEKLRSLIPDFIITQPTFGYPQVSYKVNGSGGKLVQKPLLNFDICSEIEFTLQLQPFTL